VPPIVTVTANLDGSGQEYVVQGWDDAGTSVSLNGRLLWTLDGSKGQTHIPGPGPANPPNSGWGRNTTDLFFVGDVDGDGKEEIILIDKNDGWIGILKWNGTSLTYIDGSSPPVRGPGAANPPGSGWRIGPADNILVVDCDDDAKMEVVLWNNNDLWTGLLDCATNPVSYVWGCQGTISGPAGTWQRGTTDFFVAGTYLGRSAVAANNDALFPTRAFLLFENGALEVVAMDGAAPAPTWGVVRSTDTSITLNWTGPPPNTFDGSYNLSWEPPLQPPTETTISATNYTITGLIPGTNYTIILFYFTDGLRSASAEMRASTTGHVPPPPLVTVPQLIGQTLTQALASLSHAGLTEGSLLNVSNELRTDYLKVIQQSPSTGSRVSPGSSVGMTVTAIPQPITGFSQVVITNENTDGRSVQVFLIDLANNNPQNMGSLSLNGSQTLTLQDGHNYEVVVVDVGLNGCPGLDPTNVSCQRSVSFANGTKGGPVLQIVVP
jgi:hypothetical protein